jgi:hypothetical protein
VQVGEQRQREEQGAQEHQDHQDVEDRVAGIVRYLDQERPEHEDRGQELRGDAAEQVQRLAPGARRPRNAAVPRGGPVT